MKWTTKRGKVIHKYTSKFRGKSGKSVKYTKRRKNVVNRNTVNMGKGFPRKLCFTHKYHEMAGHTSSTGVLSHYIFSCNGMFDPNITGTGHQPMFFDQLAALYNHYTVIGSKVVCKITISSTSVPFRVVLWKNDDASVTPTVLDAIEENSQSAPIKVIPANYTQPFTLSSKWSAKKTFGGSVLANDNLQGTVAANPAEQTTYVLSLQAINQSSTVDIYVDWYIQYIAIWEELREIVSS